jgi:WD40 repeat protein
MSLRIAQIIFVSSALMSSLLGCASPRIWGESEVLQDVTQLTNNFDRAGEAYFASSMRWIIFQATPKGEKDYAMFVAPLDLSARSIGKPVKISPDGSKNTCGFFSPDEMSLIFASTGDRAAASTQSAGYQRSSGSYKWEFPAEMEIFRADGWEAAVRAANPAHGTNLAKHALTKNDAYDAECAFSADGKSILFTSNRTGDNELFVMQADGTEQRQLTFTKGYDGGPFFSPDGKRVVYRSDRAGNDLLQIFVADVVRDAAGQIVALRRERQITRDSNVNWGPYWHPDGKHIIYATSAHGHQNYELYLMRADGSHKSRITYTEGFDGLPVFSPDGKYLMWSSKRTADKTTQVFIARFRFPPGA